MILNKNQRAAFERGVNAANTVLPTLEFLRHLAEIDPRLAERHDELRKRRDYLHQLSQSALHLDRTIGND